MTTQISKSDVMKRAWSIYKNHRNMFPTFSLALTRAWFVEKESLKYRQQQEAIAADEERERIWKVSDEYKTIMAKTKALHNAMMYDYYNGAGSQRRYFGD
jgi:hypothetical protein